MNYLKLTTIISLAALCLDSRSAQALSCSNEELVAARKNFKAQYDHRQFSAAIQSMMPIHLECSPKTNSPPPEIEGENNAERVGIVSDLLLALYRNNEFDRCYLLGKYWYDGIFYKKRSGPVGSAGQSLGFNLKRCTCEMLSATSLSDCKQPKSEVTRHYGKNHLRFKITKENSKTHIDIAISEKSEPLQRLILNEVDSSRPVIFQDANFDSNLDITIPLSGGGRGCFAPESHFLYSPAANQFVMNEQLNDLCSPTFNRSTKTVHDSSGGICAGSYTWFQWKDGKLALAKEIEMVCGPEKPSGEANIREFKIKELFKGNWKTRTVKNYDFTEPYQP